MILKMRQKAAMAHILQKRTRVDDEGLIAEASLAYATSGVEANDAPSAYHQAMNSDDNREWIHTMQA